MIYFTPGPSQIYPTVKKHILSAIKEEIPSISHRSERFHKIVRNIDIYLKSLLNIPDSFQIFFLSSATECMERIIENTVERHSFHFVNGAFSKRFYSIAKDLKKNSTIAEAEPGLGFNFGSINIPQQTELIAITQNETSSGVQLKPEDTYELRSRYKNALIALDITSSVPYINLNYKNLDCVFFSVQKGFGCPSGLGILMVNKRALKKSEMLEKKGINVGSYRKFSSMHSQSIKLQTVETPNILGLYIFEKVLKDMLTKGIDKIRQETDEKAEMLYKHFESKPGYELLVKSKNNQSKTVVVINTKKLSKNIIESLKLKGFHIGSGYGHAKDFQIRIANFPAHRVNDVISLIYNLKHV